VSLLETILLAFALAVDAFTVGMAVGLHHRRPRQVFRLAWHFGLFQALMPLLGALAGSTLRRLIEAYSHWVAFGLLALISGRILYAYFRPEERRVEGDLTRGWSLIVLSVAVSIDALAVGFTLGVTGARLLLPVLVIGVVAGIMTVVGMLIAGRIRSAIGRHCELLAALVLLGIGVRILVHGLS
jgi:putative Mn2+ efflux pump MntP